MNAASDLFDEHLKQLSELEELAADHWNEASLASAGGESDETPEGISRERVRTGVGSCLGVIVLLLGAMVALVAQQVHLAIALLLCSNIVSWSDVIRECRAAGREISDSGIL